MLKRHEIQVLRRAGHSLGEVVKLAGVSQSSVQRVEAEPAVTTLLDMGAIQVELEELLGVAVDLLTPGDLPVKYRAQVLQNAVPV